MEREMIKILLFLLWVSTIGDLLFTSAFSSDELTIFVKLHPLFAGEGLVFTTFSTFATVVMTLRVILDFTRGKTNEIANG